MFYWTRRTSGGSATLDGLGTVSKAEILREIVTEKLATAAQEILAVVERTVSGYEEEIDRQRKQLELLQPRVELDRGGPWLRAEPGVHAAPVKPPELDGDELVVVRKEEDGHEQRQQQGVEDTGGLGLDLWVDDDAGVGAEEDAWLEAEPAPSSRQKQQDLQDPDYEIPSRPFSQSDRRKPGRPRVTDTLDHLVLRVCILEDSQINILSKSVFKKFPVQELQCPRGLRESDFLSLLRSTFPQLAADQPFGMFTSDRSRRLQPLKVKTLTPEEICRIIQSVGAGKSALYIRLKTGEEPGGSEADATKDPPSSSESVLADETQMNTSQPEKRKRGRPRLSEPTPHCFKVSMLEDLQPDVVSADVVSVKSSGQELKCPSGVQEPDFLGLLRSTFPQVAADDTPLDVFKATRGRRLQKLGTRSLTPTEIYRTLKSTRARNSVLYIRVKTGDEEEDEELRLSRSNDADDSQSSDAAGLKTEDTTLELSSSALDADGSSVVVLPGSSAPQQDKEAEDGDAAKEEAGDHNWKPDAELQSSKRRRPKYLFLEKRKTPCSVCGIRYKILGSLIKHAWRHVDEAQCVCGVCGERFQSAEELQEHLKTYQKTCECSYCGKSFLTITGLNNHITLHTGDRPFKCDVCSKTFPRMSNLSIHRWIHVAEKPHKCDLCTKTFGLKAQLRAHRKVHTGRDKFTCHICSKSFYDLRSLTRHKATHSGERRYGCEICGKRFKLPDTLKAHEKIHTVRDRPFLCEVCCKTFVSNCGLAAHLKTHSNVRPFVCTECGKGCISNGELKGHMLVHTDEAPHSCSDCGRRFKRKTHLNNHVRSHLGIKLFVCNVCGKACSRQEHLTVHMRTHSGERPYKCSLCEKAFTQGHCLKTHMKSHRQEQNPFMNLSTS